MNREEMRRSAILQRRLRGADRGGYSTKPDTVEYTADELDTLLKDSDVQMWKDYSPEVRRRMSRIGQALPDGSFPIGDCQDVAHAMKSLTRITVNDRETAEAHIHKRVETLGCEQP